MAVPRLVVLLIAGVLLVPVAFFATRQGAGSGGGDAPPPTARAEATPAKPSTPKTDSKGTSPAADKSRAGGAPAPAGIPKLPKDAATARRKASVAGFPEKIAASLAKGQTVVLFLSDAKSADDRSTANAVRALKGRVRKTRVFTDRLRNLADYRLIVGGAGVSQSPSVVILGRGGKARVVEGYVDPQTLLQRVLDARR